MQLLSLFSDTVVGEKLGRKNQKALMTDDM